VAFGNAVLTALRSVMKSQQSIAEQLGVTVELLQTLLRLQQEQAQHTKPAPAEPIQEQGIQLSEALLARYQ